MNDDAKAEIRAAFGRRLRVLMGDRGLNARSLCWLMGYEDNRTSMVYFWLNGERMPSCENLILLRRALKCDWKELFGE